MGEKVWVFILFLAFPILACWECKETGIISERCAFCKGSGFDSYGKYCVACNGVGIVQMRCKCVAASSYSNSSPTVGKSVSNIGQSMVYASQMPYDTKKFLIGFGIGCVLAVGIISIAASQ